MDGCLTNMYIFWETCIVGALGYSASCSPHIIIAGITVLLYLQWLEKCHRALGSLTSNLREKEIYNQLSEKVCAVCKTVLG